MKKNTLFTLALSAVFLITSCEKPKCDCEEAETPVLGSPGNIIPVAAADTLYKNYGNSRVSLIELAENITEEGDTIPNDDARYKQATRYVSFSYKEMQKYMAYIEQQADSADVEILQLRVYFGKYGKKAKKKGKAKRATVFFNPAAEFTLADGTKDTVSYAIVTGADGKKRAEMVGRILRPKAGEEAFVEGEDMDPQSGNMGHLAPPPPVNSDNDF